MKCPEIEGAEDLQEGLIDDIKPSRERLDSVH